MFAVWLTGLPASGKSTLAKALEAQLRQRGLTPAVLESDELRRVFTPRPSYTEEERDTFYFSLAWVGALLVSHGVPVVFDATANRRSYRDRARALIPRFAEILVDCPPEVCAARDPKGLYRQARQGGTATLPGAQVEYEAPLHPDLVVRGEADPLEEVRRITSLLSSRGYLA
ncbi:MAG: adenylyl-sulfate kinase [Deltaproteobacteria bacterium]|nr:adenylyl-sulfate kinase [Deltaproteobacteria bacterium]